MDQMDWTIYGILGFFALCAMLGIFGAAAWIEDRNKQKRRNAFAVDLALAVKHTQPSWEEVKTMAQISEVPLSAVMNILAMMLKNILTGKDQEISQYKQVIEGYRKSHQEAEPFEGLPGELRVQLERLREAIGNNGVLLEPVTSQMRDLLALKSREARNQKWVGNWSLVVGILGVLFGTYAYFRPLPTPNTPATATVQQGAGREKDSK